MHSLPQPVPLVTSSFPAHNSSLPRLPSPLNLFSPPQMGTVNGALAIETPNQTRSGFKLVGFSNFVRVNPRSDRFSVKRFHHIEFWCGDATNVSRRFSWGLGMPVVAKSDLSTGNPVHASYLIKSGELCFLFTSPYSPSIAGQDSTIFSASVAIPTFSFSLYNSFISSHGMGVRAVAIEVADAEAAFNISVANGAKPSSPPIKLNGAVLAEVYLYGDVVLRYISYNLQNQLNPGNPSQWFLPGFSQVDETSSFSGHDFGLRKLDHAVGNVPELGPAVEYLKRFTGFHEFAEFTTNDVGTSESGLNSVVLANNEETVLFPMNEPVHGTKRKSQIQTYLEHNEGAGVQHLALKTQNIFWTLREMRKRSGLGGFEFMPSPPPTYYRNLPNRVGDVLTQDQIKECEELGILVDKDDQGTLLQIFTKPVGDRPTLFLEVIQRVGCMMKDDKGNEYQKGGCGGFGKGNFSELFKSIEEYEKTLECLPHSSQGSTATSGAGFRPVHGSSAPRAMSPASGARPVMHSAPHTDRTMQFQDQKSNLLVPDNNQANLHSEDGMNLVNPSPPETNDSEKKVEKVILDSREKLEFYRTKMQELEQKMELQQTITNMEQGGNADGILQVRADRIQSDLEELVKALSERSQKHGIEIKSVALIELPKGWQAGIQEEASVWDEEWDKFDDEGLLFDKQINVDAQNVNASPKYTLFQNGIHSHDERFSPESPSFPDGQSEKQFSKGEHTFDGESWYTHSEDESARSPHGSRPHRAAPESPSRDLSDVFAKSSEADTDFNRSFDDQGWGTFDGTDDAESVWGFNSKDLGLDQHHEDHGVFDSSSFGLSPRSQSPQQGDNAFNKRSPFSFADSVPGIPSFSKSGNSPRYSGTGDGFFDNYSRFDSFSMNDSTRFSPPRETLTRFDSTNSSKGAFDQSRRFTSFHDADPFGSTGPFKVSSETQELNGTLHRCMVFFPLLIIIECFLLLIIIVIECFLLLIIIEWILRNSLN